MSSSARWAPADELRIAKLAFRFVLILGLVNLFADFTYEGARSITGPFLGSLGATATAVGFIAGFGELVGYALRSLTGYIADKTRRYWLSIFIGYTINMFAVPALALAGNWKVAAILIIAERTGKAIRKPSVEAMLSEAGKSIGHGWVFGLNEALDQTGATIGPLVMAAVLYHRGSYHHAFALLLGSALCCLATVAVARFLYPRGHEPRDRKPLVPGTTGYTGGYWWYVLGGGLIAAGFADFALIGFHFQHTRVVSESMIPVFYSVAMVSGALSALVFGRLLDRFGRPVLIGAFLFPVFFAPFVFWGGAAAVLVGMLLWGLGVGAQDSLLKAVLSRILPAERKAAGFGLFDSGFGIAWFAGSVAMGWLYDRSLTGVVILSVVLQAAAIPVLLYASRPRTAGQ